MSEQEYIKICEGELALKKADEFYDIIDQIKSEAQRERLHVKALGSFEDFGSIIISSSDLLDLKENISEYQDLIISVFYKGVNWEECDGVGAHMMNAHLTRILFHSTNIKIADREIEKMCNLMNSSFIECNLRGIRYKDKGESKDLNYIKHFQNSLITELREYSGELLEGL